MLRTTPAESLEATFGVAGAVTTGLHSGVAKLMGSQSFPGSRMAVHGFRCVTNQVRHASEETFSVWCSAGRRTMRFSWGV